MSPEVKKLATDLWHAGCKKEARALLRLARGVSADERDLQFRIFNQILDGLGMGETNLTVDQKSGLASFDVSDMSIVQFPKFLERLMRNLQTSGTRKYKLDHIDRKDPMRVYIKLL